MGDFNASLHLLPHCQQLVLHEDWCDVGAVASRWGGVDNQPTCRGHNALAPTRNDYLLVNATALPLISSFLVLPTTDFDVHAILEVKFIPPARYTPLDVNLIPASAHDALVKKFIVDHPHLDTALPMQSHQKEYKAFILGLQQQLSAALDILLPDFVELLAGGDSDGAWLLWCRVIEDGFADFLRLSGTDRAKFLGRGQPHLKPQFRPNAVCVVTEADGSKDLFYHSKNASRLLTISRRANEWISRLKVLASERAGATSKALQYLALNLDAQKSILKDINREDPIEATFLDISNLQQPSDFKVLALLYKFQKAIHSKYLTEVRVAKKNFKKEDNDNLLRDPFHRRAFKIIRGFSNSALSFLMRSACGPNGEVVGSFTTNPTEIDDTIRRDYNPIYHGNVEDLDAHASSFVSRFLPFLFQDTEFEVQPIQGVVHSGPLFHRWHGRMGTPGLVGPSPTGLPMARAIAQFH